MFKMTAPAQPAWVRFAVGAFCAIALLVPTAMASAATGSTDNQSANPLSFGVIGDTPYGAAQIEAFSDDIAEINSDPHTRAVIHVGDIKSGSSRCDDAYFAGIRADFDTFRDPLVYTPGDNEWTDCHRASNGGYIPTERLAKLREVFFDQPGRTLGRRSKPVEHQNAPFVENVRWMQSRTVFGTLHVVGSNNGLLPWFGAAAMTAEQSDEVAARTTASLEWIDAIFDKAASANSAAVVVAMQADMWDSFAIAAGQTTGFNGIVERLADRAAAFGRPVLLLQGDSHEFVADNPLANGSPAHGVTTPAPNVARIVVNGASSVPHEWLRVRIDPRTPSVFSWDRIPFGA
ncbi:MAG: hypothetical protein WAO61_07425 [Solirubrobacterales bacterium]